MEVKLDKRYALEVSAAQAWVVLADIRAVAGCMPGAQITEQIDGAHFKGTVRAKVGPALMQFGGDVELRATDAATRSLELFAKGADRSGSSASMNLAARLEEGQAAGSSVLVGVATVTVSGKLAQFGSRLLVPVSDAMLAQFADNFRAAAAAVPPATAAQAAAGSAAEGQAAAAADAPSSPAAGDTPMNAATAPAPPPPVPALNALALMWTVFKGWLAGLFGSKS